MKKQITRISVLQSSKIVTALYVLFGFIYLPIGVLMIIFGETELKIVGIFYMAMPVVMAVFGFFFFALFALLYNLLAKWMGGFEVEVSDIDSTV